MKRVRSEDKVGGPPLSPACRPVEQSIESTPADAFVWRKRFERISCLSRTSMELVKQQSINTQANLLNCSPVNHCQGLYWHITRPEVPMNLGARNPRSSLPST